MTDISIKPATTNQNTRFYGDIQDLSPNGSNSQSDKPAYIIKW